MVAAKYSRACGVMLMLAASAVCLALAAWQLQRADYKERLLAQRAIAAAEPPLILSADAVPETGRRVAVAGRFDMAHQFLLDNQVRDGRVGVVLLTPLRRSDGSAVLVRRGWLPMDPARRQLPVPPPTAAAAHIEGRIRAPAVPLFVSADNETFSAGWPRLTETEDTERLAGQLGYPLASFVVEQNPALNGPVIDRPMRFGPQRHRAYALQWFILGVMPLLLYQMARRRRRTGLPS